MKFNENLLKLENQDSFYNATKRIKEYKTANPNNKVVSLGIGDVSLPVIDYVANKMMDAVKQESSSEYVGYGNYYGLEELRKAIKENEYQDFSIDEIYVGQGTKSDVGDILELFDSNALIGIPTPNYPIYENACIALNKNYELIECDDMFAPKIPNKHFDAIFICSPSNPIGISYSRETLKSLIDYANKENCILLVDNVYFKFISSGVKSIYEIEGAKTCAIEFRSFSKHLSFTGIRCSYYVIPNNLKKDINKFWKLRTINRFNGASYIAQVGALSSFDKEAKDEIKNHINYYKTNTSLLKDTFLCMNYQIWGGENAPYIWVKCKNNKTGWDVFEEFLTSIEVIVVPGSIFGKAGENFFRVSALGKKESIIEAIERIKKYEQESK